MPLLRYLAGARSDLSQIQAYISRESGNPAIGRNFTRQLRLKCKQLVELPGHMGRSRQELGSDIRSVAYRGYIIFFRYSGAELQIINILEGHRDVDRHFAAGPSLPDKG